MNNVFCKPQVQKDLGGRIPSEEREMLATRPSTVTPLDHISLCGAGHDSPVQASRL